MSCQQCEENRKDGGIPPCEVVEGEEEVPGVNVCWLPPLDEDERRVLRLRNMLSNLAGKVDSNLIIREFGATLEELEMVSVIEGVIEGHRAGKKNAG